MHGVAPSAIHATIRYSDQRSYRWLWTYAPCAWQGNVTLRFQEAPLASLCPAGCLTNPAIVAARLSEMRKGHAIAPLVVCENGAGGWYIHDGNHRYRAMSDFFAGNSRAPVRVAVAVPRTGLRFVYRWFGNYGTYVLEPAAPLLSPRIPFPCNGRIMLLVAHQDDETVCAGLLQRLLAPIVVFATDGAPADESFWHGYSSRANYGLLRRTEAQAALFMLNVSQVEFLNDYAPPGLEFRDQQLFRALPEAFEAVSALVRRYRPGALLVPAYEGGHPDHDSCSFLGALLRRRLGIPVWEMPLYNRSNGGELKCQEFRLRNGTERGVMLSRAERQLREKMIATYASQDDLQNYVSAGVELFRPQAEYDYSQRPHPGTVNYEFWQWPITPDDLCRAFNECARTIATRFADVRETCDRDVERETADEIPSAARELEWRKRVQVDRTGDGTNPPLAGFEVEPLCRRERDERPRHQAGARRRNPERSEETEVAEACASRTHRRRG